MSKFVEATRDSEGWWKHITKDDYVYFYSAYPAKHSEVGHAVIMVTEPPTLGREKGWSYLYPIRVENGVVREKTIIDEFVFRINNGESRTRLEHEDVRIVVILEITDGYPTRVGELSTGKPIEDLKIFVRR